VIRDALPAGIRRHGTVLVTTLLTFLIFALLWHLLEPRQVVAALAGGDPLLIGLAALVALLFNTVQSAELQRWLIRGLGARAPYLEILTATVGNLAIQGTLPASFGHFVRASYLHRRCGVPLANATAAAVTGLWFKLCWLLALSVVGQALGRVTGLVLVAALVLTVAAPLLVRRLGGVPLGDGKLARAVAAVAESAGAVRPVPLLVGAGHALISVVAEVGIFWLLLLAMGVQASPAMLLFTFPMVILGSKVPVTPMGLGTREAMVVVLLSGVAQPEVLVAAALAYSVLEHLLPSLVGTVFTWSYIKRIIS
jgi:uncharacterized membrane protein YbhN (UPF0104 family)